jgi:hypothetical protein
MATAATTATQKQPRGLNYILIKLDRNVGLLINFVSFSHYMSLGTRE